MDLDAVLTEVDTAVKTIAGLRTYPWTADKIASVPAVIQDLPDEINFHMGYGTGAAQFKGHRVILLSSRVNMRTATKTLTGYVKGTGAKSIKQAIETYAYTSCDHVTVTSAEFDVYTIGGVAYLGAAFICDITGPAA